MSFPFGQYINLTQGSGLVDIANGRTMDRIGVEGAPGMEFQLNGETLTLGRNGCYEVETDVSELIIDLGNIFLVNYHIKEG